MTKPELIELVRRIAECDGTEAQIDAMLDELKRNVPHPASCDLIFWPEPEMTPAQIVDELLAYQPIALSSKPVRRRTKTPIL